MARISVFDMMKIGVGPSSSHTLGPWRAALRFLHTLDAAGDLARITAVRVDLYGSLAKTGKGHGTDFAVLMGLRGADPVTCDTGRLDDHVAACRCSGRVRLLGRQPIPFDLDQDITFHLDESLPYHPNGLAFTAVFDDGTTRREVYYSVGGGFVVQEGEPDESTPVTLPYPSDSGADILAHCRAGDLALWQMVWANELAWRDAAAIRAGLAALWEAMLDAIYRGCHTEGVLPGGLNVSRRAARIHRQLMGDGGAERPSGPPARAAREAWLAEVRARIDDFPRMIKWVSCFALAVNEENAAYGRVVTAPTNGAAGVIPAVLLYYVLAYDAEQEAIERFLLVAGIVGTLFKKGATISAAQGGCQAEIGVSAAMAAAALCEGLGGSPEQALMAAEIAMEHHLGLTCDPVRGLVQVPCIERNAMGAMKAITAAHLAVESAPDQAKITLDGVIRTMWATAQDMNEKYKETSEGGLAMLVPVNVAEC